MVKIRKGNLTLTVAVSSFHTTFKQAGWELEENGGTKTAPPAVPNKSTKVSDLGDPEQLDEDSDDTTEGDENEDEDGVTDGLTDDSEDSEESDELTDEELEETPLGELGFEDLKRLAELRGLDYSGLRSKKEVRALIRSNMK